MTPCISFTKALTCSVASHHSTGMRRIWLLLQPLRRGLSDLAQCHVMQCAGGSLTRVSISGELGDYSTEECKPGYVNHIRLVPHQTSEFEAEATEAHKSFR